MEFTDAVFDRARLLLGSDTMRSIGQSSVILFGVGGVGSWCAEGLIRSGIRHLTIVDGDRVCVSNINRQLMATVKTVGQIKVDALKEHLLLINPEAEITTHYGLYSDETANDFHLDEYDYIIDCIDSLKDKVLLIENSCRTKARFYSSMGAALKLDPTRVQVAEFWNVKGCPLARALRQRFKKLGRRPARKFQCIFSDELLTNKGANEVIDRPEDDALPLNSALDAQKAQTNGSIMHITAIFGLTLAGLVIKDINSR